jgi:aspartate-semialdehyde dehydrogenase
MKLKAAILGATGAVGQRYLSLLKNHPTIEVSVLMGMGSAGKKYSSAVNWILAEPIPDVFSEMNVIETSPKNAKGCDIIFSALPSDVARDIEEEFASKGFFVVSEASSHRMDEDVPLMIPEVNPEHLEIIRIQKKKRNWKGSIITTPNCTVTGLAIALKPLDERFQVRDVIVTTMQALSGAGFPGVPSISVVDNIIPYIKDEEEKVNLETRKILGKFSNGRVKQREVRIAASCNRVAVLDGHMECVYVTTCEDIDEEKVKETFREFSSLPQKLKLPTAPEEPIIVREEKDRPQPRLDRLSGSVPGMSVVVGRIRNGLDRKSIQFTLLSHNTIRGAAGNAILTTEMAERLDYLDV